MIKPTQDEVRRAIESSGYPLEIRVAHSLMARGYFDVTPSWHYRDPKTGESREVDVVAWQPFDVRHQGEHCQSLMLHLLIECKRSPAFVVYSANPKEILTGSGYDSMALSHFGRPGMLWKRDGLGWTGTPIIEDLAIGESRWKWPECVGSHYTFVHTIKEQPAFGAKKPLKRPQFKSADEDYYHQKLLGLLKAVYLYREPYIGSTARGSSLVQPHFVIPLLVVDADLYEYNVQTADLRPINRAALCRSYSGEFSARFRIDVVTEAELDTYLNELTRDFSGIASQIGKQHATWQESLKHELEMQSPISRSRPPVTTP